MSLELSPNYDARFEKGSRGNRLSVLATIIAPLFAVLLTQYLNSQEKHQTTFAFPVQVTDASRQEEQHPAPRPELSMANDSPTEHVGPWQAFPLKSEKQALAKMLIERAIEIKDDPASQFVMLRLAKDIATQASDGQTAFQAIDTMAQTFQSDADTMKMAVLTKFADAAQNPAQHKSVAEQALKLVDQAVSQDHFMVANQLGILALTEAKKALDKELFAQAQSQIAELAGLVKAKDVDTGAFIALTDADDANHRPAAAFYRSSKEKGMRFVTTNFVICETMNYLRSRVSHQVAVSFRENLNKSGFIEMIRVTPSIETAAFLIFKQCSDKDFSFTDCTSFSIMRSLGLKKAFAFDKHFEQLEGISRLP